MFTYNVEAFLEVPHRQNSIIRMNQVSNSKIYIYRWIEFFRYHRKVKNK